MPHARSSASPLAPILGFTALTSFAAGTATLSIFFVTAREPYSFSAVQQYALGLVVGVTYALGALGASAVRRRLHRLSARALLLVLSLALALLVCLPVFVRSDAAVFVLLALYAPLTGILWPLVEGYVSGGRRAGELRSAIGRFNIVWSSTLLPSFLCIPPLLARASEAVFVAVALAHLVAPALLLAFRPEPGAHAEERHAAPAGYAELLRVHRVLHALSYLVMYALSPVLPTLLTRVGVPLAHTSWLAATWLAARAVGFAWLERWHGWHGRWSAAVVGAALVVGGFGATVLAPNLGAGPGVQALVLLALALFGLGLAALYTAALYYVFEVGGAEGGGSHEALIGLGYSVGPLCGLLACALEARGVVAQGQRNGALLVLIALVCALVAGAAWLRRKG